MKTIKLNVLLITILSFAFCINAQAQSNQAAPVSKTISLKSGQNMFKPSEKLVVVWTSGDKDVAEKMVFMYVYNAKKYGWWKEITLLIWGPSSKLLSEDKDLQAYVKKMKKVGVDIMACKACADMYKVSDKLAEIGARVKYAGKDLTDFIKKENVVTF